MFDPEKYTIVIRKTNEDKEAPYVAHVIEFPYVKGYGKNPGEAYEIAADAIRTLSEMDSNLPTPLPDINKFGGRISLRIAKSLHRKLANFAEVEGVSINQFLGNILAWASENYYKRLPGTNANFAIPNSPGQVVFLPGISNSNALLGLLGIVSHGGGRDQNVAIGRVPSQKFEAQILDDKEKRPLAEIQA